MRIPIDPPETEYASDLEQVVFESVLCDTHEHQAYESDWRNYSGDVLSDLLSGYVPADLVVAGASEEDIQWAIDPLSGDLEQRLNRVAPALARCRFTGYGEAVYLLARHIYGMESLSVQSLEEARPILENLKQPGGRLGLLRDVARLDHVQIDDFCWECLPDDSGEDFFLYDISWADFASGEFDPAQVKERTGVEIRNLDDLGGALERIFENYATCAVAVKTQHAYRRTLAWEERPDSEVEKALQRKLSKPTEPLPEEAALCLGDWCLSRGIELATRCQLPFKIHTGYYAGVGNMPVERIRPGNLSSLLTQYPEARFVLMHIGYPYQEEMVALAKQYPNVYVDLCWAWSIDPYSTKDFLKRLLHAVPVNRVLGFGGDTRNPTCVVAYSLQARRWMAKALAEEVEDGFLTETEAIDVADHWMRRNQYECFGIDAKREMIRSWNGPRLGK